MNFELEQLFKSQYEEAQARKRHKLNPNKTCRHEGCNNRISNNNYLLCRIHKFALGEDTQEYSVNLSNSTEESPE